MIPQYTRIIKRDCAYTYVDKHVHAFKRPGALLCNERACVGHHLYACKEHVGI